MIYAQLLLFGLVQMGVISCVRIYFGSLRPALTICWLDCKSSGWFKEFQAGNYLSFTILVPNNELLQNTLLPTLSHFAMSEFKANRKESRIVHLLHRLWTSTYLPLSGSLNTSILSFRCPLLFPYSLQNQINRIDRYLFKHNRPHKHSVTLAVHLLSSICLRFFILFLFYLSVV